MTTPYDPSGAAPAYWQRAPIRSHVAPHKRDAAQPGASSPAAGAVGSPLTNALLVLQAVVVTALVMAGLVLGIIEVGPRVLPYQALVVRSGSMAPALPVGSVVFYREEPTRDIRVGQIILFGEPGHPQILVSHRVVGIFEGARGRRYFVTKGDANPLPDVWRVPLEGPGWVATGYQLPYLGFALAFLSTWAGHLALLAIPLFALALLVISRLLPSRRAPPWEQLGE